MKKENTIISLVILVLMLFIETCTLWTRISYENSRKQIYLSANMEDIKAAGLEPAATLTAFKNAGANFATVSPKTVEYYESNGAISAINFSSLKINEDSVSASILPLLEPYGISDSSIVVICINPDMTSYLKKNLYARYQNNNIIEVHPDENTAVFCFPDFHTKNIIVGYEDSEIQAVKNAGLSLAIEYPAYTYESESYPQFLDSFIAENKPEFLILRENENDNKLPLQEELCDVLEESEIFLTVWENENQISNEHPFIYNEMKDIFSDKVVRGFNMDKIISHDTTKYKYRYYQWYNSALERNTTFLNANILKNTDITAEENLNLTLEAVKTFTNRFKDLGYTFPATGKKINYSFNLQLSSMCGGVVLIILIYAYLSLLGIIKGKNTDIYLILSSSVIIILSYVFYDVLTKFYALGTMITAVSLLTLILYMIENSKLENKKKLIYILCSFISFVIAGGITITALLSDFDFFLGDKWFAGVKISLIVPIVTAIYNYYYVHSKNISIGEWLISLWEGIKKLPKYIIYIVGGLLLIVAAYYLIRTGKSELILPLEDKFRKALTDIFIIRPRLKEFLIGYPAFALFIYLGLFRKNKMWCGIFGILQTLLFTSVLNTFCHTFTPVWVGALRFFNGLISGIIICAIIIGIFELIIFIRKKQFSGKFKNFFKFFRKNP